MTYLGSKRHQDNARAASEKGSAALRHQRAAREAAYILAPLVCAAEGCVEAIPYAKKATNRYCSKACSARTNNRVRTHTSETKEKISSSLLDRSVQAGSATKVGEDVFYKKTCLGCGQEFLSEGRRRETCSAPCLASWKRANMDLEEMRARGQRNIVAQMEAGKWKGWSGRSQRSFPEEWVALELARRGVTNYVAEKQVGRYSLDFAFEESKLVLEVDGKQHRTPEGKAHDKKRDAFLRENGWEVFRLAWVSVRSEAGKRRVEQALTEFLEVLRSRKVVALEK